MRANLPPIENPNLLTLLDENNVEIVGDQGDSSLLSTILVSLLPFLLIIGLIFFMGRQMSRGQQNVFGFGRSKARQHDPERPRQAATPRQVLLDRGQRPEPDHRAQAAEPDPEHHEHQAPAAADAERAVGDAHGERFASDRRPAPAVDDEPERASAFVEAAIAERAGLPQPGNPEGRAHDQLRVTGEPVFSVQHHPEASPGPQDSHYLFKRFVDYMERAKRPS